MRSRREVDLAGYLHPRACLVLARTALSVGAVLFTLALLGAAELVARGYSPRRPDTYLGQRSEAELAYRPACRAADALGARHAGLVRIAVVGESSGEKLATQLSNAARDEGSGFRIAACAQSGSGLEDVDRRFQEVVDADPDVVVVVFGHNLDFDYGRGLQLVMDWLRGHSYLFAWARGPGQLPYVPVDHRQRLARFERFLREAARASRTHGFRLVVTTVTPNYWMPPADVLHDRLAIYQILQARYLRALHDPAAESTLTATSETNHIPGLEFELGFWLRLDGRVREARVHLDRALDQWPDGRVHSDTNALIRRVATEEHILLRDTLANVEARTSDGIPGWESLVDNCHLREEIFVQESQELLGMLGIHQPARIVSYPPYLEAVSGTVRTGPGAAVMTQPLDSYLARSPDTSLTMIVWRLLAEGRSEERAFFEHTLAGLDARSPPMERVKRARLLVAAANAYRYLGRTDLASSLNQRAREGGGPESAPAWVQYGLWELEAHRTESATESFGRAAGLDPTLIDATTYLGFVTEPRRAPASAQ